MQPRFGREAADGEDVPARTSVRSVLLVCLAPLAFLFAVLVSAPAANAVDYPLPSSGNGSVDQSSVEQGGCVTFTGDGFKPGSTVVIKQDGQDAGTATTDENGAFSKSVCFASDARVGAHELTASGAGANGAARVVTATVNVLGVQTGVTPPQQSSGAGGGGGLTGADVLYAGLFLFVLTGLGALLVLRGRRDQRERRRARLSD